jgi:23S rRNA pseudouridine1911/1915/1917 synthase
VLIMTALIGTQRLGKVPMADVRSMPVPDGLAGERVDVALTRLFGLSRSKAADLVTDGAVQHDGTVPSKSDRVHAGAWLEVQLPDPPGAMAIQAEPVDGLVIVHEDDDIVVVDKPVGVAAHPSPGWSGPTVLAGLAAAGVRVTTSGAAERQGIVHRLDVGTSGLMVVAKSEQAYTALKRAFKERTVDKTYHALVQGHPDPSRGTIDAPVGRHPVHDYRWAVVAGGKDSVTHYETLEAFAAASLLEVHLETGRTHQIRVHFSALRHPCVGDLTYGADPTLSARLGLQRQWLHAVRLGFTHPVTREPVILESRYPADLSHALDVLGQGGAE